MEITVKMSEKEFVDSIEYKKDKKLFLEKYKKNLIDIFSESYSCSKCEKTVWIRKRIQDMIEEL